MGKKNELDGIDFDLMFETLAKFTKGLTHLWTSTVTGETYLKKGPKSSGRKGETIAWTGFGRRRKRK